MSYKFLEIRIDPQTLCSDRRLICHYRTVAPFDQLFDPVKMVLSGILTMKFTF